ncbi:dipeptide/oligopeptide/nickel ABC transporter permease/ATP-binding protein [Actinomadura decatromicini]|uniref:Dipeptide/oligopeptide/nickel ABC transporter permease/ATP-binding protein n=1 Tax=Actinomadura decatromicini TaxID=2604572 RepID=A0A5D3FTI8_9ACTN|nr:dipeptide/oligopeptide/nickel ABC transporter permease/ATP-binding protein [Actinomadura decatromicini]TYK51040.1 dipeptide/oligopeptide/nickel ABC transporter permease/ATP-binding protein [Actinomadura decatromicini]
MTAPSGRPGLARRLLRHPLAVGALLYLAAVVVLAVFAPVFAPYGPQEADLARVLATPTADHWLGTDSLGRDIASRLMFGARPALLGVLVTVLVAAVIAIPVGLSAALSGGADRIVSPLVDLLMSIPAIVVLLMVLATFDQELAAAMAALGVLTAPGLVRVVRAAALTVAGEPYVAAARVYGFGRLAIALRHVLPRVTGPVLVNLSLVAATALLTETGLNFLGLGVHLPEASWGGMVADASAAMNQQNWMLVPTGAVVAGTVIALVLLGDGVRDATAEGWARPAARARSLRPAAAGRERDRRPGGAAPADGPPILLRVEGLTVAVPGPGGRPAPVVDGVSFDLRAGETLGIVGESGCGKTMTGRAVLGLLPDGAHVTGGSIRVDGADATAMGRRERAGLRGSTIAFVSQEPMAALDPLFTVGGHLAEAVRVHTGAGRGEARRRAVELLGRVRLPDPERVAKTYPHQLSGGMAQRVAIALALAGGPRLLIADEPTTALDVTVQAEILRLLRTLQRETGMAILLISHDWGTVGELCERTLVMYAGQVVESGPTATIVAAPQHPYSEGLLAANPQLGTPGVPLHVMPGGVPAPGEWPPGCHFAARCPYATDECTAHPIAVAGTGDHRSRCVRALPTDVIGARP